MGEKSASVGRSTGGGREGGGGGNGRGRNVCREKKGWAGLMNREIGRAHV